MVCSIPRNCIEGFSVACDVPLLEHDHQIQSQWNCLILSPPILAPGWRTTVNNGKHLLCNGITVDYNHFEKPLSKRITGHAGMNEKHAKNIMWKMSQTYQNWFTRHTGSSCTGHQRVWFLLICLVTIEWCCSLADTLLGLGPCCLPWRTARYEGPSWRRASTRMWCKSLVPQHGYEWGTIPCTLWILWSLIPVLETLVIPVLTMKFAWSHQTWISSKHFQTGDEKHHLDVLISWDLSLSIPFPCDSTPRGLCTFAWRKRLPLCWNLAACPLPRSRRLCAQWALKHQRKAPKHQRKSNPFQATSWVEAINGYKRANGEEVKFESHSQGIVGLKISKLD